MQQVFIEQQAELNQKVLFTREQAHHLATVLRMKSGEIIRLVDQKGRIFLVELNFTGKQVIGHCFEEVLTSAERSCEVTLLMGLIKKDKWDFCLQKSTELGVKRIVPFESRRTIVKSKEEKADKKIQRWNKLVLEAAQQCKRDQVPEVLAPIALKEAAAFRSAVNLVAYESLAYPSKKVREALIPHQSVTIVIGPEGGFDEEEIVMLEEAGFVSVTLGKRILRAETAALYMLSAIDAILE